MPKGIEREWPTADEVLAGIKEHGSISAYARALDTSDVQVHRLLDRYEIRDRLPKPKRAKAKPAVLGSDVSREEIQAEEIAELRSALKGERRREVRAERMLLAIERVLDGFEAPEPLVIGPQEPLPDGDAHHRALLLLSDAHGGEVVEPAAVSQVNAFDWDIMHARHEQIVAGTLSHMRRMPPLSGLDIGLLGDGCSGANHRELEVSNEFPLAQQGIAMGFEFGEIVAKLAGATSLRVFGVPGNHPRLTEKPAAKSVLNNMDYVSMIVAQERTRGLDNVVWHQPEGAAVFWEIAGRRCYVWHGDGIRSTMPGVPWGGVMRRTNEIQRQHVHRIDHYILGHFHEPNVVQGGRIVMNGSVKGVDEWVLKQFGGGSPPTQLLLLFDERARRLTDVRYLTPTAGIPGGDA